MTLTKKQLATVDLIRLSVPLDSMEDTEFEAYCKNLDKFVFKYPDAQEAVKKSFEERDSVAFSRNLLAITGMMTNVGADDKAQVGIELLGKYREAKYDEAAVLLNDLLTAASTLSIDIQMAAQYKETNAGNAPDMSYMVRSGAGSGQKSILAVDDVSLMLNTLKSMLEDSAYRFAGVISGRTALKYLEKNTPDLFILDIEMPDMDGYELAGRIRALGNNAPIIFLTGNATTDYLAKAIKAGAADFIVKPVNKEYVLGKIKKFI